MCGHKMQSSAENTASRVVGGVRAVSNSGSLPESSPISAGRGDPTLRLPPYWHLCLHPITHLPAIIHHPSRSIGGHAFISPWLLMGKRRVGRGRDGARDHVARRRVVAVVVGGGENRREYMKVKETEAQKMIEMKGEES